jgi:hypothetical protein
MMRYAASCAISLVLIAGQAMADNCVAARSCVVQSRGLRNFSHHRAVVVQSHHVPVVVQSHHFDDFGQTQYGYRNYQPSYQQYAAQLQPDPQEAAARLDRAVTNAQQLLSQAMTLQAQHAEKVLEQAKISAAGAVAVAALQAANAQQQNQAPPAPEPQWAEPGEARALQVEGEDYANILQNRCMNCHGDTPKNNAFSIGDPATLDGATWELMKKRMITSDPAKRMPKNGSLTVDELSALLRRHDAVSKGR